MSTVSVGVNVAIVPVIYVQNEVIDVLMRIASNRNLDLGYFTDNQKSLTSGLFTWLTTRTLEKIVMEILERNRVIERFDLSFQYSAVFQTTKESNFETNIQKLEDFLSKLPTQKQRNRRYRIVAVVSPNAPEAPGWGPTNLNLVDHLKKQNLGGLINADYMKAEFEFWGE